MEMNEAWPDIYDAEYMHQIKPGHTHKIQQLKEKDRDKRYPPMKHFSSDHEDRPNQFENSHKLCNKKEHPFLGLKESHWEVSQQYDKNLLMEGK